MKVPSFDRLVFVSKRLIPHNGWELLLDLLTTLRGNGGVLENHHTLRNGETSK